MIAGRRTVAASALLAAAAWADAHSLGVVLWLDRCSSPVASLAQAWAVWIDGLGQVWTWSFLAMGLLCLGRPWRNRGRHHAGDGHPWRSALAELALMWLTMPLWCVLAAQLAGLGQGLPEPFVFTLAMAFGGMLAPLAWRRWSTSRPRASTCVRWICRTSPSAADRRQPEDGPQAQLGPHEVLVDGRWGPASSPTR